MILWRDEKLTVAANGKMKRLQRMGRLIEVAPDHFFLSETVAELATIAAAIAQADSAGTLTAAEFRDRLANGRKVAIQILEFFDRVGYTRRIRDAHVLRAQNAVLRSQLLHTQSDHSRHLIVSSTSGLEPLLRNWPS